MDYACTGIDISAKKLQVATDDSDFEIDNTPEDHQKLIQRLRRRGREVRVCMESTGVYGLDLAMALYRAEGIEVGPQSPRAQRANRKTQRRRCQTRPCRPRHPTVATWRGLFYT